MSTDWEIKCLDCNSLHGFNDANHQDKLMLVLIKHAGVIAALAPLLAEDSDIRLDLGHYGNVDVRWFAEHHTHRLKPIDEYGRLLDQCRRLVDCGCCGVRQHCMRGENHEGKCSPNADAK